MYNITEDDGSLQPVLILSNPLSSTFTVQVEDIGVTASGKHITLM